MRCQAEPPSLCLPAYLFAMYLFSLFPRHLSGFAPSLPPLYPQQRYYHWFLVAQVPSSHMYTVPHYMGRHEMEPPLLYSRPLSRYLPKKHTLYVKYQLRTRRELCQASLRPFPLTSTSPLPKHQMAQHRRRRLDILSEWLCDSPDIAVSY
ncbi:uncharacterized protein LY79DRAFT_541454 [Colletotrichum navitas]|uniref:Uncharacterized protein n=1 Tax=Colletotrichum navitas TaxID=681940 RepID=A0AAD8Q9C8_9PEZI|nr:uncharacterized protein LY79DRAFT_541454 [Colletotrichum navitas]KAK1597373.1 hypothetical protein LY79DRAFT_541454 [Colletotrichum navitas]